MKKLMCALAAVAVGVVFAEEAAPAAVQSQEIVGYANSTVPNRVYTMYGPSFNSVSSEVGMKLKDLTWNIEEGGDTMLKIDTVTAEYTTYNYLTQDDVDAFIEDELLPAGSVAGWYYSYVNEDGDDVIEYKGDEVITRGCGFWLYATHGNVPASQSGKVMTTFTRTFPNRVYSSLCNPFPTAYALKNFTYPADEGGDTMLWIVPETSAYLTYNYLTQDDVDAFVEDELLPAGSVAGWYYSYVNEDGDDVIVYKGDQTLAIGQGVWMYPSHGDVTVTAELAL